MNQIPAASKSRRELWLGAGVCVGLANIVFSVWLGTHRATLWAYEDFAGPQSFVGAGLGAITAAVCAILLVRSRRSEPLPPVIEPVVLFQSPEDEELEA